MNPEHIEQVVDLLMRIPPWSKSSHAENRDEIYRAIADTCRSISAYDLDTIRAAMKAYIKRMQNPGGWIFSGVSCNLFLLNQYLFDLPRHVRRDAPLFEFYGGGFWNWTGSGIVYEPCDSDVFDLGWPWAPDETGRWHISAPFAGFSGSPYEPLKEFDKYRAAFSRRREVDGFSGSTLDS